MCGMNCVLLKTSQHPEDHVYRLQRERDKFMTTTFRSVESRSDSVTKPCEAWLHADTSGVLLQDDPKRSGTRTEHRLGLIWSFSVSVRLSDEADKAQKDILASHSNIREKILANRDWRFGCKMDHSADRYMTASTGWTQRRLLLIGGLENQRLPVAPRLFTATKPSYIQATHESRGEVYFIMAGWSLAGLGITSNRRVKKIWELSGTERREERGKYHEQLKHWGLKTVPCVPTFSWALINITTCLSFWQQTTDGSKNQKFDVCSVKKDKM